MLFTVYTAILLYLADNTNDLKAAFSSVFHICSLCEAPKEKIRAGGEKPEIVLGWLRYGMAIAWRVK